MFRREHRTILAIQPQSKTCYSSKSTCETNNVSGSGGVTVIQHEQNPETEAAKWNSPIMKSICDFPTDI